jgi:hypothetical protein
LNRRDGKINVMTSLMLPLMLLGGSRLAYAQDPPVQAPGCLPNVEDPASRGLFIADPDGLIPEHVEASLHLSAQGLAQREGLLPRILTARSSLHDAEACVRELAARWSVTPTGVILLWVRSPPELALWVSRDDGAPLVLAEREAQEAAIWADGLTERGEQALVDALPRLAAARRATPTTTPAPEGWSWPWLVLGLVAGALLGGLRPSRWWTRGD